MIARVFSILSLAFAANAFQLYTNVIKSSSVGRISSSSITSLYLYEDEEFEVGESYKGDVDWDAEWKKVVDEKNNNANRPGKDFYKNDVEKAAAKATRAAQEQVINVSKNLPKVQTPDIRSLQGDATVSCVHCQFPPCFELIIHFILLSQETVAIHLFV